MIISITFRNDIVDIITELNRKNIEIFFCRALPDFERKLKQRLVSKDLNAEIFFRDANSALKEFQIKT